MLHSSSDIYKFQFSQYSHWFLLFIGPGFLSRFNLLNYYLGLVNINFESAVNSFPIKIPLHFLPNFLVTARVFRALEWDKASVVH